jgi:hypothetical protein
MSDPKKPRIYRNVHSAPVGHLTPGAEGVVDPENSETKTAIAAGHLVFVDIRRYRNAHTASIDSIAPGAEGDLDSNNPGVRVAVEAGKLVPVGAGSHMAGKFARLTELEAQNAELQRKVQELEARGSQAPVAVESQPGQAESAGEPGAKPRRG